jgi:hypothetical protein
MTIVVPTLCRACIHVRTGGACNAFPDGRPDSIAAFGADHHEPVEGDHGIQFELDRTKVIELRDWQETFGTVRGI